MNERKARILIVEDETHLAIGLKLNLQFEGFLVDVASTAREAAQLLLHPEVYQLLVLDVMLPDLDGFALCRQLRDAGNFTPLFMLTARSSAEDRVTGLEAGADDYIVKPFDLAELLARIRSALRRSSWNQKNQEPSDTLLQFGQVILNLETRQVTHKRRIHPAQGFQQVLVGGGLLVARHVLHQSVDGKLRLVAKGRQRVAG